MFYFMSLLNFLTAPAPPPPGPPATRPPAKGVLCIFPMSSDEPFLLVRPQPRSRIFCTNVGSKLLIIIIIIIIIIITTTTTVTAIEFSLGGSSPYTSTDTTNKNKYT